MDSIPFSIAKSLETAFDSIINGRRQDNELTFTNIYHGTETTYTLSLDPRCRSRMKATYSISIRRCYDKYTTLEMRDVTNMSLIVMDVPESRPDGNCGKPTTPVVIGQFMVETENGTFVQNVVDA